jgi:integrase
MDFDAANGSLRVEGKSQDTSIRHIFLTEEGTAFFSGLVAGRAGSELVFIRHGVERGSRKDLKNADGWLKDDFKTPMRRACKDAQIEPLVFHELRHTYASSLIAVGVPLMVAHQLGHADTRMVEQHYGHLAPSATKNTIRALAPTLGISGVANVADPRIPIPLITPPTKDVTDGGKEKIILLLIYLFMQRKQQRLVRDFRLTTAVFRKN